MIFLYTPYTHGGPRFIVSSETVRVCTEFDSGEILGQVQSLACNFHPSIWWQHLIMLCFGFQEWVLLCCATDSHCVILMSGHPVLKLQMSLITIWSYIIYICKYIIYRKIRYSVSQCMRAAVAIFKAANGFVPYCTWGSFRDEALSYIYKLYIIIITVIILFCRVVIRHFEVCLILWDWINQEPKDVWSAILPAGDMASEGERIATS